MTATILTIGDEILIGQIVDSNAAWLGDRLASIGIVVARMETVGDDRFVIREALLRGLGSSDVVIATGGLGPTHDDITREAIADSLEVRLEFRPEVMTEVERVFLERKRDLPEANRKLALVPEGFETLSNPVGTAPGLWGSPMMEGRQRYLVAVPGVPLEMKAILRQHILPRLTRLSDGIVLNKTLLTVGLGESALAEYLGDLSDVLRDGVSLAYLPGAGVVRLRISAKGRDETLVRQRYDDAVRRLRAQLGDLCFGEDDNTLEGIVGKMLVDRGMTIAVAESCTGGTVAGRIASVAGASRYFVGGIVAYDNGVKIGQLGVPKADLEREGAVSETVARQMAEGVRAALGTDVGISTTGVAGPDGGSAEKPVGTVWLGYADSTTNYATMLSLSSDRSVTIRLSTTAALNLVRRQLLRRPG